MARIISFSLGNIWRWSQSRNRGRLIRHIKSLDISGVEIVFPTDIELHAFDPKDEDVIWLKSLPYTTLHAPFHLFSSRYSVPSINNQLDALTHLYDLMGAKAIVFHPASIERMVLLTERNFHVVIENLPPSSRIGIPELRPIFAQFPTFSFCLDVSHAYLWSKHESQKLTDTFGDRLAQVHLSGTYRRKSHQSLRAVTKGFLGTLNAIEPFNIPLVVEEDFKEKGLEAVKHELTFIRGLFNDARNVTI